MIYLIDEKKLRQENYSWTAEKFEKYKEYIKPVYTKEDLDLVKNEIFARNNNILLFHDSFFDAPINKHRKDADLIRQDLLDNSHKVKTVSFSGGVYNRIISSDRYASLPVEWVYKNLGFFIQQYQNDKVKLEFLAYGKNYLYEEISSLRNKIWDTLYKNNDNDLIPLDNKMLMDSLSNLLDIVGKTKDFEVLLKGSLEARYFKYKVNNWIKDYINNG